MLSEAALALEVRINDDSGSVMDSVKLIASDMDGTLLNGKGELAASMSDCSGPLPPWRTG